MQNQDTSQDTPNRTDRRRCFPDAAECPHCGNDGYWPGASLGPPVYQPELVRYCSCECWDESMERGVLLKKIRRIVRRLDESDKRALATALWLITDGWQTGSFGDEVRKIVDEA